MSNSIKHWYALFTKPNCEKKVANLLSRKNIQNYCPMKRECNGGKKAVLEPLFTSYVFIKVSDADLVNFRLTDNIINFVYWLGKPAVIREEEIETIERFLNEFSNLKVEKIPFDVNGNKTRVIEQTWADNVISNKASIKNSLVKVVLPSLGYMIMAELNKFEIEVMTSSQPFYTFDKYQYVKAVQTSDYNFFNKAT
ncbi:MAG: UpxY family transcription antiterminator [Ferruginibacter sp.]